MAHVKHKPEYEVQRKLKLQPFSDPNVETAKDEQIRRAATAAKGSVSVMGSLAHHNPSGALARALFTGVKLAKDKGSVFFDELARPIDLAKAIKDLGPSALTWNPETLCSVIDGRFGGWTKDRVAKALEHFHATGELDTAIPPLTRQKIYAIRVVATSDSAHNFWENFEKVGCVFNDRLANFSEVQGLSAAECARTIAIIENIRPDQYSKEVRIYIAACCHQDGFYTLKPSQWLRVFNPELQEFNESSTGSKAEHDLEVAIQARYLEYMKGFSGKLEDSTESLQAVKLIGIDHYASDSVSDHSTETRG